LGEYHFLTDMSSIHIAHITDLHIAEDLQPVRGVDTASNFKAVLQQVLGDKDINSIVLGGDLCYQQASLAAMQWIKGELDATGLSYRVIPGNHDDSLLMAEVFGLQDEMEEGRLFFWDELDFGKIFYLDTGKGDLPMHQLVWVDEECSKSYHKFLIFMHHPPVHCGVPYMDNRFALTNMEQVQKVLRNINNIQGIFCGHYHVERTVRLYNHLVMVTPSTYLQIDDASDDFVVGSYDIGWRKISWDGSNLRTSVRYLASK
jgi:3',5'-cyclic-AMP phosphodiesterase